MKKFLTKILLISIFIIGFGNINQTNAGDLDGFENIFNEIEGNQLDCANLSKDIYWQAPKIARKVNVLFDKLDGRGYASKKTYIRLVSITDKYLKKIDKNTQKKMYSIFGHINCKANSRLKNLNSKLSYKIEIEKRKTLNSNDYYDVKVIYLIKDGRKIYIEESDGNIKNAFIKGKYLIYDLVSTGGSVKRIYDINNYKLIKSNLISQGNQEAKEGVFVRNEGGIELRKVFSKDKYTKVPFTSYFYKNDKLLFKRGSFNKHEKIFISNNHWKDEVIIITFEHNGYKNYIAFINGSKKYLKLLKKIGNISILSSGDKIFLLNKNNNFLNGTNFKFTNYEISGNFITLKGDYYGNSVYFVTDNNVKKVKIDNIDKLSGNEVSGYLNGKYKKYKFDYLGNFTEINKKGELVKYIGGGVEARQNKLYTYFYYNGKLINTIKNKVNNDGKLIYGDNVFYSNNDYLSEYYAKRKLDLYSAKDNIQNGILYFEKKIDGNKIKSFGYNLKTGKWENYE